MTKQDLTIIITTYNSERYIWRCIESAGDHQIILVDNNSKDNTVNIAKKYGHVKIIRNDKNLGFAAANNQALRLARGEYVFLLNADAFVEKDYIKKLLDFLDKNKDYGSVTGKLLKLDNSLKKTKILDGAGHLLFKNDLAMMRGHGEKDTNQYKSGELFGVAAAASLYRKKMLDDIKISGEYFDEDFFAYFEDLDIDMRARKKGWKAYYLKDAVAHHYRGASSKRLWQWRQALKNRFLFMIKHEPKLKIILNSYWILMGIILFTKRLDFIRNIFRMLKKRIIIKQTQKINNEKINKWKQPYPYRQKIKKWMRILFR